MNKITFIGLGLMGSQMASRLAQAGYQLTVWNRTASKSEAFKALGASIAPSLSDSVDDADLIITMLSDPDALDSVLFGPSGIANHIPKKTIYIDMSTTGPLYWDKVCMELVSLGLPKANIVDGPVLGSVPQAQSGTLDIFVGGDPETFERIQEVFKILGNATYVGMHSSAASLKLVINSCLVSLQCIFGEALCLGDLFNLETKTVLDALEKSSLEPIVRKKRANIESQDFTARFTVGNALKDCELIAEASTVNGIDLKVIQAAKEYFYNASQGELVNQDYSAVTKEIRSQATPSKIPEGTGA